MRRSLSRGQRAFRHSLYSIAIYFIAYQLIFKHLPEWVGMVWVLNMIVGYQVIDSLFKRMGSSTLFEAYTFFGCVRFLAMATAWPLSAPMLRKKVEIYEKHRQDALALSTAYAQSDNEDASP